jgi:hypothetical protein
MTEDRPIDAARDELLRRLLPGEPNHIRSLSAGAIVSIFEAAVRADERSKTKAERDALRAALREIDEYKYDDRLPPAATLQAIATRAIAALTEGEQP